MREIIGSLLRLSWLPLCNHYATSTITVSSRPSAWLKVKQQWVKRLSNSSFDQMMLLCVVHANKFTMTHTLNKINNHSRLVSLTKTQRFCVIEGYANIFIYMHCCYEASDGPPQSLGLSITDFELNRVLSVPF